MCRKRSRGAEARALDLNLVHFSTNMDSPSLAEQNQLDLDLCVLVEDSEIPRIEVLIRSVAGFRRRKG